MNCLNCGSQNKAGLLHCERCGMLLVENPMATRQVGEVQPQTRTPWGTDHFVPGGQLTLRVGDERTLFKVNVLGRTRMTVGRGIPKAAPDVDLIDFGAAAAGVSREHALLIIDNEKLYIEDLGSTNGTYVNGARIAAHERRALLDGNEIMLGRLKIQVFF